MTTPTATGQGQSGGGMPGPRHNYLIVPYSESTISYAYQALKQYLLERSPTYQELCRLRDEGWKKPEGDEYFQKQRKNADSANKTPGTRTAEFFYRMMQEIAVKLNHKTRALHTTNPNPVVLDACMPPGGFLKIAMALNPRARAVAFALPQSEGGHRIFMPPNPEVSITTLDITMLAADMGVSSIPLGHPDAGKFFLDRQLADDQRFDLALCDGQVLRTHPRAEYRKAYEAQRLLSTQLALSLQHLKPGGTMVVLLHKAEAWDTALLLYKFNRFAQISLYKPSQYHAKRSSFYLIAANVQSNSHEARLVVQELKDLWKVATFGSNEDCLKLAAEGEKQVGQLLEEFGPKMVEIFEEIWDIQRQALAKAPFMTAK